MLNNTKKLNLLITIFIIVVLQGCASTGNIKLTENGRNQLKALESVKVIHQRAGWPSLNTPAGVLASNLTFGLSEDWTAGQKLIHKFGIDDPGKMIKEKFLDQAQVNGSMVNFESSPDSLDNDSGKIEAMKQKYQNGVVLKISSYMWQIWYYPFNWARYQMWYGASAELVRLDDSKVLWSANCRADQNNKDNAPTLDELTKDNSVVLENWMDNSTTNCTDQLMNSFLGKL